MKKIILVAAAVVMSGCAEFRAMVATNGAEASDASLSVAVWELCAASPVGAIDRRFNTPELKAARELVCGTP